VDEVYVEAGGTVDFEGSGLDPEDGTSGLSYEWSFGSGSGVADVSGQDTGPVVFDQSGTYTVSLTVVDAQGAVDPTPATVRVHVGGIDPAGWSVPYVDSQELVGEDGAVENAFDGDPATYWHSRWLGTGPGGSPVFDPEPLPHELAIDLGGFYELEYLRYLPRQGNSNGRIKNYEIYVSLDGTSWGSPVASGVFPNSGAEQVVALSSASGRYLRIVELSEVLGRPYGAIAELAVFGSPSGL
jgi:hypothetical protein